MLNCTGVFLAPRPTDQEISNAYEAYYTHTNSFHASLAKPTRLQRLKTLLNPFSSKPVLTRQLRDANYTRSKILDVGCGSGRFLLQTKRDFPLIQAYGVDFDPSSFFVSNYANGFVGSLSDFLACNPHLLGSFSLITLHHSLEHLTDIHADLIAARQLLSETGTIYIETPNNASLSFSLLRQDWLACDPPRHLFIFNSESLRTLLTMHNLTVVTTGFHPAACTAIIPLSVGVCRDDSRKLSLLLSKVKLLQKTVSLLIFLLCVLIPRYSDFVYVKVQKTV